MKKVLVGVSMLAVACMVCGPAFAAVPHTPITGGTACSNYDGSANPPVYNAMTTPYGAPATSSQAGSIPIFSLLPTFDNPVTSWPTPGNYDFCAAFDTTACALGTLAGLSTDVLVYQSLFFCTTDINGPDPGPEAELPVAPNGIPDGEFELGLIAGILNDVNNSNNAAVTQAFKDNYNYIRVLVNTALGNIPMKMDARSLIVGLAGPYLHTGLTMILAGYCTEGDPTTIAALDLLVGELSAIGITPPPGGIASVTTGLPAILGPDGDADGDGYSNRAEYNYFKTQGAAVTIDAQLDPNIYPPATVPRAVVLGGGTYEVGASIELKCAALNTTALTYQWNKDGAPLANETASSYLIQVAGLADSGKYVCTITDANKSVIDSPAVTLNIVPAGSLPIAGGLGLALLAGACALGGVGSIRRRK